MRRSGVRPAVKIPANGDQVRAVGVKRVIAGAGTRYRVITGATVKIKVDTVDGGAARRIGNGDVVAAINGHSGP